MLSIVISEIQAAAELSSKYVKLSAYLLRTLRLIHTQITRNRHSILLAVLNTIVLPASHATNLYMPPVEADAGGHLCESVG